MIKMFEDFDDKLYKSIDMSLFNDMLQEKDFYDFTNREIDRIKLVMPKLLNYHREAHYANRPIKNLRIERASMKKLYKNRITINIFKMLDDYYLVENTNHNYTYDSDSWFECDSMEGLQNCLRVVSSQIYTLNFFNMIR